MSKSEPRHYDIIGREITVGSIIAAPSQGRLQLFSVLKLTPKMLSVKKISSRWTTVKYPCDAVVVEGEQLTMYLLSQGESNVHSV